MRNLLKENKDLRNMVKQMAGFIAEGMCHMVKLMTGLGSCLPRLGLSAAQLDAILNRSDTDTAYEAFVNLKASKEMEEKNPGVTLGEIKRKTPHKRKRDDDPTRKDNGTGSAMQSGTNTPEPINNLSSLRTEAIAATNPAAPDSYSYLFPSYDPGWAARGSAGQAAPGPMPDFSNMGQMPFPYGMPPPTPEQLRMYGMPSPMYPPWNTPFGDFGGFGLTVSGQGQGTMPYPMPMPMDNAPGPSNGSQQVKAPGPAVSIPGPSEASGPGKDGEDRVREALTRMMHSKGLSDGRNMTAEEVDERVRVQKDLMEALKEDEGMRKRTEPFQLIAYHINK